MNHIWKICLQRCNIVKRIVDLNAEGATEEGQIRISKQLYNGVMSWDANDFGSIIRNQGYFQRGVIHNIVDETDFKWKVGEEKNEHK